MHSGSVITDLQPTVETSLRKEYCARCGFAYTEHSAGLMDTPISRCPSANTTGVAWTNKTFKKYARCEGEITYNSDPTGAVPCGSSRGMWRPEWEEVLCDGCAEGM